MAIAWPASVRWVQPPQFNPDAPSRSGGQSLSGIEQVVTSASFRWRAEAVARVVGTAEVLAYRAFLARARGRANTILVPICGSRTPINVGGIAWDDGFYFDDGFGFSETGSMTITASGSAALNATTMNIDSNGWALQEGMYFSISNRLHLITEIISRVAEIWTVRIEPPLRAALSDGASLEFGSPVCEMRLASDESGALSLDLNRFANPALSFVEA